jgi:hypothetical protein
MRASLTAIADRPQLTPRDWDKRPSLSGGTAAAFLSMLTLASKTGGNVTTHSGLTRLCGNAALRLLQCEARMSELLADIVAAYGRHLDAESLEKTRRYLEILGSTVRTDDLPAYGLAYLEQLHNPDPRYSGC